MIDQVHCTSDTPLTPPSKYRIREVPDGFHVEGVERHPVYVRLSPTQTAILVGSQQNQDMATAYQPYAFHAILKNIAKILLWDWVPPADRPHYWANVSRW